MTFYLQGPLLGSFGSSPVYCCVLCDGAAWLADGDEELCQMFLVKSNSTASICPNKIPACLLPRSTLNTVDVTTAVSGAPQTIPQHQLVVPLTLSHNISWWCPPNSPTAIVGGALSNSPTASVGVVIFSSVVPNPVIFIREVLPPCEYNYS